jgi:hypothetical protein
LILLADNSKLVDSLDKKEIYLEIGVVVLSGAGVVINVMFAFFVGANSTR